MGEVLHGSLLQLLLEHCDFLNINISQGSVATRLRCGGIFKYELVANLPMSLSVKKTWKSVNIWGSYGQEFSVLFFLRHSVFSAKTAWQLVNQKADFFTKRIDSHNESNRINSNRELECSSNSSYGHLSVCLVASGYGHGGGGVGGSDLQLLRLTSPSSCQLPQPAESDAEIRVFADVTRWI